MSISSKSKLKSRSKSSSRLVPKLSTLRTYDYYRNKNKTIILGKGAFGCVIYPHIPCQNNNKNTNTKVSKQVSKQVSKLLHIKKKNTNYYIQKYKNEFEIGQILKKIDKQRIFFIGANNICFIEKKQIKNIKIKNALQKCIRDRNDIFKDKFVNITLNLAYDFEDILPQLLDVNKNIFLIFAHLVLGIQKLTTKTNLAFLDIKYNNLVFNIYKNQYIHPVFIDFSPGYIIGHNQSLAQYIHGFQQLYPLYPTWTPELKFHIMKENEKTQTQNTRTSIEKFDYIIYSYLQLLKKMQKNMNISNDDIQRINLLKNTTKQNIYQKIEISSRILLQQLNSNENKNTIMEPIMLWELAKLFTFFIPIHIIHFSKYPLNSPEYKFYNLLQILQDFDFRKRLMCKQVLNIMNDILNISNKNKKMTRYMIKYPTKKL